MAMYSANKKIDANGNTQDVFLSNVIGSTSSSTAPELSTFDSGNYIWKKGTYIKIYGVEYSNPSQASADIPFELKVYSNTVYMIGNFGLSSGQADNAGFNIHSFSSGITMSSRVNVGKLNGSSSVNNWYAPTTAGTSGQFLKSNGGGAPTWETIPTSDITSTDVSITEVN